MVQKNVADSEDFLKHIQEAAREQNLANIQTVLCKQDSVELPDASVDLVFTCDTNHHFEFPFKTLSSIHRALKPDGKRIVVDYHRIEGKSTDWVMGHVRAGLPRETDGLAVQKPSRFRFPTA